VLGIAAAGLVTGQGLAFAAAGWAAQVFPPAAVTATAGGLGTVIACALAVSWRRLPREPVAPARMQAPSQRGMRGPCRGAQPDHRRGQLIEMIAGAGVDPHAS